jgi:cyclin-dependent kinase 7
LIDHKNKHLFLIDFGQAHKVEPNKSYSPHVGTLAFRAPEIFFGYEKYSYPVDVWSAGMTFLYMLAPTVRTYFHIDGPTDSKKDHQEMIRKIAKIFGSQQVIDVAKQASYKRALKLPDYPEQSLEQWLRYYLSKEFDFENKLSKHALDLLSQMLTLNWEKRITIKKALKHRYFQSSSQQRERERERV